MNPATPQHPLHDTPQGVSLRFCCVAPPSPRHHAFCFVWRDFLFFFSVWWWRERGRVSPLGGGGGNGGGRVSEFVFGGAGNYNFSFINKIIFSIPFTPLSSTT